MSLPFAEVKLVLRRICLWFLKWAVSTWLKLLAAILSCRVIECLYQLCGYTGVTLRPLIGHWDSIELRDYRQTVTLTTRVIYNDLTNPFYPCRE